MGYKKDNYQKNTNLVKSAPFAGQHPTVNRTKTDGRIGSASPASSLKGGFTVNNNSKAGPPGKLGSQAMMHMSAGTSGEHWSPRVAKARKMATPNAKPYANPLNHKRGTLTPKKPD